MAVDCIIAAAEASAGKKEIPRAVKPHKGDIMIELPVDLALKLMLRNAMFRSGIRVSDLARLKGVRPQAVFKVLDLSKSSRLSSISTYFDLIGRPLKISC